MDGLQAPSSSTPSPLSTFPGDLFALLRLTYTEPSPAWPNFSAYGGQLGSSSRGDTTIPEASWEFVDSDDTAKLEGGLSQLPLELRNMIIAYVLDTHEDASSWRRIGRKTLSKLSLVCRSWSHTFRPRLFEYLHLKSRDDVHFLGSMLHQPQSGWLSAAVRRIVTGMGGHVGLERILVALSRKLPSLQHFHQDFGAEESLGLHLWLSLQHYKSLHTLRLINIKVSSFSLLVKLLGSIPQLNHFSCANLNWIHQEPVERPPSRMAPFLHLSQIRVEGGCSSPCTFLWLFHPMILRRCAPSSTNVESHDIMLMVTLAESLFMPTVSHIVTPRGPTFYEFLSLRLLYDSALNTLSFGHYTVALWPTVTATSDNICSAIRSVEIPVHWLEDALSDGVRWEAVDTTFAQKAINVEAFSISSRYGHKSINTNRA